MTKTFIRTVAATSALLFATAAFADGGHGHNNGNGEGPPDFVNTWHGLGSGHQANNDPGDTASDRHGFADATTGNSDQNPTDGSAQANDD